MQLIGSDALIFALGIGGFILFLLTLIALLSVFRQRRAWKEHQADTRVRPPKRLSEAIEQRSVIPPPMPAAAPRLKKAPAAPPKMPAKSQTRPLSEDQRLPVREATPDQLVIQIDPPEGPTRDQRNVERLIAFLKNESKPDAKVS